MHKTHIFDQKNNAKIFFYRPTYPNYFRRLQETNNIFFLALQNTDIKWGKVLYLSFKICNTTAAEWYKIDNLNVFAQQHFAIFLQTF